MGAYQGRYLADRDTRDSSPKPQKPKPRNAGWLLLALWLSWGLPELILHLATATGPNSLVNSGLVLPLLFSLVPVLGLFTLISLIPARRLNGWLCILFSFTAFLLCASQLVYYRVFGTFYSAYSMSNGGQVLQFWNIILRTIWENLLLILAMGLPFLFFCTFAWRCFSYRPMERRLLVLIPLGCALAVQLVLAASLPAFGGTEPMSAYDLYHANSDSYFSVNRLGLFTAFRLDVTRLLTGYQPGGSIQLEDPTTQAPTTEATAATQAPTETTAAPSEETTAPTEPPIDTSPNVLDIDFQALMDSTDSKSLREVHQYFSQRTPSNKNEHTGLFAGSNLILITAEAFDSLIVDETRTPTLYKLMHEGYYFTNYYVPDWGTSTTDGEYAFLTGTVPKSNVWSFYRTAGHAMPLTMCQQLMAQGYQAYAYHGHTYDYYHRDQYLENLGYTYRAKGKGLPVENVWPESDVEVVDLSTGDYVNNAPFTVYYMTISGHREFTFLGNTMAYRNRDLVKDEPYSNNVRAYIACQLELEKSMTLLLERLEEAGQLENTVIVLTPDHYPNGLTREELSELAGHQIETNFEIFKNGCIIYKPGMTPETIDAPCSHLDLLPTLSNLFGLEFDSRLYMGRDVFSDAEPLVMFRNRSWITDLASYNSDTGQVTPLTDEPVSEEYVQRMKNELENRFTVSSRILDEDYWRILFGE